MPSNSTTLRDSAEFYTFNSPYPMTRRRKLMVAALMTTALASTWFFADSGRAPFSRKGMTDPMEDARAAAEAARFTPEEQRAAALAFLERREASLRTRIHRAEAVDGWFSALRHARAEAKDTTDAQLASYFLRCFGGNYPEMAKELRAGLTEQTELWQLHMAALEAAAKRAQEADYYGNPIVKDFYRSDVPLLLERSRETQELWFEEDEALAPPAPECRFAETAERLDWMLRTMRQRTRYAAAVKHYAGAKTYVNFNIPEHGGKALNMMTEARAALDPQEEHDCESVKAIRARQQEITEVWEAFQQAEDDMRARAAAADYYGVPELAELP